MSHLVHRVSRPWRAALLATLAALAVLALATAGAQAKVVEAHRQHDDHADRADQAVPRRQRRVRGRDGPGDPGGGAFSLPVVAGIGRTQDFTGVLVHAGGLRFTKGGRSVVVQKLVAVRTQRNAVVLAQVPGLRGGCAQGGLGPAPVRRDAPALRASPPGRRPSRRARRARDLRQRPRDRPGAHHRRGQAGLGRLRDADRRPADQRRVRAARQPRAGHLGGAGHAALGRRPRSSPRAEPPLRAPHPRTGRRAARSAASGWGRRAPGRTRA